jgi:hypothetical protein
MVVCLGRYCHHAAGDQFRLVDVVWDKATTLPPP